MKSGKLAESFASYVYGMSGVDGAILEKNGEHRSLFMDVTTDEAYHLR